ncbi:hypothetical protein B0O99DRAFT_518761 [Bisporella sp. PMI_857]|nr:hypothetical protein B0O99DRAFT_518761 [Bisporella sp. PMI_857]
MGRLASLPYEVLSNIIKNVDLEDVFNLAITCKGLLFLVQEESICKLTIQSKIGYSKEAYDASSASTSSASALRRAVKRRHAIATACPYLVAMVGLGDAFIYTNSVLGYVLDESIRVLDLHNSHQLEHVISIPKLLTQALPENSSTRGIFRLLYYSYGIISSIYKSSDQDENVWLISFDIYAGEILIRQELASTDKILVRNNKEFLYYGTHSELGHDGYKKWVVHGYNFSTRKWFDQKIHLPDVVGSEVYSTVCFEFYKDYFYAVSNQTSFEEEEIDWTSYYHCIRFPLDSPCQDLLERSDKEQMWRRQHQEGPIDDRWTNLRLDVDEIAGDIKIVESRKEWHLGTSKSQRSYYTTDIKFPETSHTDECYDTTGTGTTDSGVSSLASSSSSTSATLVTSSSLVSSGPSKVPHDRASLPNDPLIKLLQPEDNPFYMPPPPRYAQNIHRGQDGSSRPTVTLAKCRVRHYHTSAMTYFDLVDDPLPEDLCCTQRLRLRAGSRKLGPPLVHPLNPGEEGLGLLRKPPDDVDVAIQEMYQEQQIQYWPPALDPKESNNDWDAVYRLLNPSTHLGNVEGVMDERSLVYATGGCNAPRALIFIGFDPSIKLAGLKTWSRMKENCVGEGPHIDDRASGRSERGEFEDQYIDVDEINRTVVIDSKGKGKEKCSPLQRVDIGSAIRRQVVGVPRSWVSREKAMYLDIGLGFYFGKPRK